MLLAGASPPGIKPNTMVPVGKNVPASQRIFPLTFDQDEVRRPSVPRKLKLVSNFSGTPEVIMELDTSIAKHVSIKVNTLTFYLPQDIYSLEEGVSYSILMDPGAVVGLKSCSGGRAPFRGISDLEEWSFESAKSTNSCQKNDGKGNCEDRCIFFEHVGIYHCWCDHNNNFALAPDGHSCIHLDTQVCKLHGILH